MDEKKQKILLGVLGVLVLGMGSFWYFTRDTGSKNTRSDVSAQTERKSRYADSEKTVKTKKRTRRTAKSTKSEPKERATRVYKERETKSKRRRGGGKKKIKKKKFAPPLAMDIRPFERIA